MSWLAYEDRPGYLYLQRRRGDEGVVGALTGIVSSRPWALAHASAATTVVTITDTDSAMMLCQTCVDLSGMHASTPTKQSGEERYIVLQVLRALGVGKTAARQNVLSYRGSSLCLPLGQVKVDNECAHTGINRWETLQLHI